MESVWDRDGLPSRVSQMVHNVVETSPDAAIANVLLESDGDTLRLTATGSGSGERGSPCRPRWPRGFRHAFPQQAPRDVKELPAAGLTLKVQENSWVAIAVGGASYKLVGLSATDFPAVATAPRRRGSPSTARCFVNMLTQTILPSRTTESRYALNGVLFGVPRAGDSARGNRRHRLALVARPLAKAGETCRVSSRARRPGDCPDRRFGRRRPGGDQRTTSSFCRCRMSSDGAAHRRTFHKLRSRWCPIAHPPQIRGVARRAHGRPPACLCPFPRTHQAGEVHALPGLLKLTAYSPDFGEARGANRGSVTPAKR